jgi:hypothetical protein
MERLSGTEALSRGNLKAKAKNKGGRSIG